LGIGDWGLGIGDCNPQSPIPNPQTLNNSKHRKIILKIIY